MRRKSNQEIITSIQNGEEEVLFYISGKYFPGSRKWLRRHGCRDIDTPWIFSRAMVDVYRELQQNKISPNIDFELFFFNFLKNHWNQLKEIRLEKHQSILPGDVAIVASCFTILDESARKILSLRYCEKLSFEQIAARLEFSNPVIAQFEFNRAFSQFENIANARLNVNSN